MDQGSCSNSSQPTGPSTTTKQLNDSLCELYKPAGVPRMQVLFFHGFQLGDYEDAHLATWKSRDGSCIWPQTWLADEFPEAHILSVSYNARLKRSSERGNFDLEIIRENLMSDLLDSEAKIGQEPGCPVILVGHSFGGLVMKQLCLHARKTGSSKHKRFLKTLKGLFFYSTPHHGMIGMEEQFGGLVARFMGKSPLLEYVKILSTPAARLDHDFDNLSKKYDTWQIAALGENLPTKLGQFRSLIVVPEASSRYGDFVLAEAADHVTVCKPEAKTSRIFNKLTRLLHDINSQIEEGGGNYQHLPNALFGIQDTLEEVKGKLEEKFPRATSLGFAGMGGIGKSTLAMALFNVLRPRYDYTCFIKNVKSIEGFGTLDVLEQIHYRGKKVSKKEDGLRFLRGKEVLMILDDVDSDEQLEVVQILTTNILFMVHENSRFVATSRDSHLLDLCLDEVYQVPLLSPRPSKDLFLNYASPSTVLPKSIEGFAHNIVRKCEGLPLTLEVIGKSLHKKPELIWEQAVLALDKAEEISDYEERLWAKLRVSYNNLDKVEQHMFLDCGTLFYNEKLFDAKVAWSITAKGFQDMRWQHLIDMSLVRTASYYDDGEQIVDMHEQLHSLAKRIATTRAPNGLRVWDSNKESWELLSTGNCDAEHLKDIVALRLSGWHLMREENIEDVEDEPSSSFQFLQECLPCTQGVAFTGNDLYRIWSQRRAPSIVKNKVRILGSTLRKMGNLQYLSLRNVDVDRSDSEPFPSTIVSLELRGMHFTSLPFKPSSHKELAILLLNSCRLQSLPTSFGQLSSSLQILEITGAEFKSLPNSFGKLVHLKKLSLKSCKKIQVLPTTFGGLMQLIELEIFEAENLKTLPLSFGSLSHLQSLKLSCCSSLTTLPESFGGLSRLQKCHITGCDNLQSLPKSFVKLLSLEDLVIGPSRDICMAPRVNLPQSFGCLAMLQNLCKTFGGLAVSEDSNVRAHESLLSLPDSIEDLKMLNSLKISSCNNMQKLPETFGHLVALESFRLVRCRSLSTLPHSLELLSKLKRLEILSCQALHELHETIGNLVALEFLVLDGCDSLSALPNSVGRLSKLSSLRIGSCDALQRLPETLGNLAALKRLEIANCKFLLTLPDSLGRLAQLEELRIRQCCYLQKLPETLGDMVALEKLSIWYCENLSALPDSFGRLPRLKNLEICGCELLHELPDSFLQLQELESIDLHCTYLRSVPNMENLFSLKIIKFVWDSYQRIPILPKRLGEMITEKNYDSRRWAFKVVGGQFIPEES